MSFILTFSQILIGGIKEENNKQNIKIDKQEEQPVIQLQSDQALTTEEITKLIDNFN